MFVKEHQEQKDARSTVASLLRRAEKRLDSPTTSSYGPAAAARNMAGVALGCRLDVGSTASHYLVKMEQR
jgi:hypothetical protein